MQRRIVKKWLTLCLGCWLALPGSSAGQGTIPQVLDTARLQEQWNYLQDRTRIYNDYRTIREDMFQKLKRNTIDSLNFQKGKVRDLTGRLMSTREEGDSLMALLEQARKERDDAIRNRDRLSLLGIGMHKTLYNTILWAIIAGLAFLVILLFTMFRTTRHSTVRTRKDLEELKEEYENYRKQSRERYEKLVVSHHHEIKKLKEGRGL